MKKISKAHVPPKLKKWLNDNAELNHTYSDLLGTDAHRELKERLLEEQGYLDAYTGKRIDDVNSHVEHIKPQNKCDEWEDVEYRNLVACFPVDGGDKSYGYGAPVKAGWWDETLFLSPLSDKCERKFKYEWSGKIKSVSDDDVVAKKTINVLGLDHTNLKKLRESRIKGFFGFGHRSKRKQLTKKQAESVLQNIYNIDSNGQLMEFCFIIKQLLPKYIAGIS